MICRPGGEQERGGDGDAGSVVSGGHADCPRSTGLNVSSAGPTVPGTCATAAGFWTRRGEEAGLTRLPRSAGSSRTVGRYPGRTSVCPGARNRIRPGRNCHVEVRAGGVPVGFGPSPAPRLLGAVRGDEHHDQAGAAVFPFVPRFRDERGDVRERVRRVAPHPLAGLRCVSSSRPPSRTGRTSRPRRMRRASTVKL